LDPDVVPLPVKTFDIEPAGRSWTKAAVFFLNRGKSGTFSHRITAAARSLATCP
jgi:hypothetical protein